MNEPAGETDHDNALYRVTPAINATLDLDDVLHFVARNVTESVGVKACAIRLLSPEDTFGIHPTT